MCGLGSLSPEAKGPQPATPKSKKADEQDVPQVTKPRSPDAQSLDGGEGWASELGLGDKVPARDAPGRWGTGQAQSREVNSLTLGHFSERQRQQQSPPRPGAACAAAAGPTQRLSAPLLSPLPGDTAAARRARSEGGGESGQEQRGPRRLRTTWGWFAAAGRSGPTWARAEAAHTCGRHTRPIAKCRPQKEHAPLRVRGHCAQTRSLSPDGRKDRGSR